MFVLLTLLRSIPSQNLGRALAGILPVLALMGSCSLLDRDPSANTTPFTPGPASEAVVGTELVGLGTAINGDTLVVKNRLVRLWGMDAMEPTQTCMFKGQRIDTCGEIPKGMLERHLAKKAVVCTVRAVDAWGRAVSSCKVDGTDLGSMLVHAGYALSTDAGAYVVEQAAAERAHAGVWDGFFMQPWNARTHTMPN